MVVFIQNFKQAGGVYIATEIW